MLDEPRHANCISKGPSVCYVLSREDFEVLIGSMANITQVGETAGGLRGSSSGGPMPSCYSADRLALAVTHNPPVDARHANARAYPEERATTCSSD